MYKKYISSVAFFVSILGLCQHTFASHNITYEDRMEAIEAQLSAHGEVNSYLKSQGYAPEGNFSQSIAELEYAKDNDYSNKANELMEEMDSPYEFQERMAEYEEELDYLYNPDTLRSTNREGNQAKHAWGQ